MVEASILDLNIVSKGESIEKNSIDIPIENMFFIFSRNSFNDFDWR